jgi:hypothetical protein
LGFLNWAVARVSHPPIYLPKLGRQLLSGSIGGFRFLSDASDALSVDANL